MIEWAKQKRDEWDGNPHAIHKRPPFAAKSFDGDHRYWVVGSTGVSVLHGVHGPRGWAEGIAAALNSPEQVEAA